MFAFLYSKTWSIPQKLIQNPNKRIDKITCMINNRDLHTCSASPPAIMFTHPVITQEIIARNEQRIRQKQNISL